MINHSFSPTTKDSLQPLTEELLDALLEVEETYPWDPTTPEAEAYFSHLEGEFPLIDAFDEAEITAQADTFFSHLHQAWESVDQTSFTQSLLEKFGQMIPKAWLETIIIQAEQLASENISQLNQLVECVKPLWTNWTEEDLQVFARPLAQAMRGETKVKQDNWQDLSEIEQIRFTMAIAKEVLCEIPPQQNQ
ncbi:hypothetical protein VB715_09440 [Crocosphaera sp. UHCC 0190]|uniref:hypothetical protein n=1 Tax=Crocosphaera sp. UHCC 0190 TaxID=3110246 RepID=UPI002B211761|nr:hypothetical protein [Crocosphaera sp. UHCC 0190]MEA5509986.1 hypothetical protein [Crocosphaera sp. UHCC 0190]